MLIDLPPRLCGRSALEDLLVHMSKLGGSDMFLLGGGEVWLSLRSQKVKITQRRVSDTEVLGLLESFYGASTKSLLGAGKRIDTAIEFERNEGMKRIRYRYRVNAVSCIRNGRNSTTITFREIPTTPPRATDIGVEQEIIDVCRATKQGLILVVGATGNGKSTLLAAVLRDQLEDPDGHRNLVTVEAPVEFVYDDIEKACSIVTQLEVPKNVESFHAGVVNSLRMAPTTILVGEARDYETVSAAIEASVTGHTVFSTVHANSVAETFQRLVAVYPEQLQHQARQDVVQALKLVVAQRLVRTVDGSRTAIREYLVVDQQVKEFLASGSNIGIDAMEMVRRFGKPMQHDIQAKYDQGQISSKEYNSLMQSYG